MKVLFCLIVSGVIVMTGLAYGHCPSPELVEAQIRVESGGNDYAIGDKKLAHKAYGCLQIRQPLCDDLNRRLGTNYQAKQCLGNRDLSLEIYRLYVMRYATAWRLDHAPTDEDIARIWNGGPDGYKKASTVAYWNKVRAELRD